MKALRGFVGSRPSSTSESQPSTSAIFPSLRKLDLPADQLHESPLLTLTLSASSFLDTVVKDEFSDTPLYIIETHRERTGIYRCETENITTVAKAQWPSRSKMISANAVALSGISVQMHGGRWRAAEEFLKFGSLFASRKFHIPHHPHSLKWRRVGGSYTCTCSSIKGPLAILQAASPSTPPRLRVYSSLLQDDRKANYGGVPHILLDYLVATSLLLVTDVEEYLHRPSRDVGDTGSAMEAFLPSSLRHRRNGRGSYLSTESRSPANSNENISLSNHNPNLRDDTRSIISEAPSTPSSAISQFHPYSFFHLAGLGPDVPPVPEVPPEHQASVAPILPRSSTLPPLPALGRTPTIRRRLPQPPGQQTPITPPRTEHVWGLPSAHSTPNLTSPADSLDSSMSTPPPLPTSSPHSQHLRQTSEFSRSSRSSMSISRRQLPPQRQPPQLPVPIPPKLREDLVRSIPPSAASSDEMLSSTSDTTEQAGDPDSSIHENGSAGGMGSDQLQEFHRRFSSIDDGSAMRASVYELPPPAYDAIDFSLPRPPVLGGEGYQSFSVNSRLPPEQIS